MNIYECPICKKQFQVDGYGIYKCPSCNAEVNVQSQQTDNAPWDNAASKDRIKALWKTFKKSLTNTVCFFEDVKKGKGMLRPAIYAIIINVVVILVFAAYEMGFSFSGAGDSIKKSVISNYPFITAPIFIVLGVFFILIVFPFFSLFWLFMQSAILHLCLIILRSAKEDFQSTFRVICYSTGPQIFGVVPVIGGMISGIWYLVLAIIGIKVVHETTYLKSVLAIFLPLIFCCGIFFLFVSTLAGGIFTALISSVR